MGTDLDSDAVLRRRYLPTVGSPRSAVCSVEARPSGAGAVPAGELSVALYDGLRVSSEPLSDL